MIATAMPQAADGSKEGANGAQARFARGAGIVASIIK
ncbi:hypothetical protein GGE07_006417 [Sinorhizobium terangae]|nr:hypothetical protein [Sinorhizobium terangae]